MAGCAIDTYLLEKSRVVGCGPGERTYHALYQVLSDIEGEAREFPYLARGGCVRIDGVDDAQEFATQLRALDALGVTDRQDVLDIVAAVLHLGCAEFDGDDARCVNADTSIGRCAPLLGLDATEVETAVTTRTERMGRGSIVTLRLTTKQARSARDALAKALYGGLFDYLVRRVNESLRRDDSPTSSSIGVLDIFGFEVFRHNSFEQLCINYANEKLQLFFDACVFGEELRTYEEEGVPFAHVQFEDNARCVALFDGRPVNLFSLLDDECQGGEGARDDRFGAKCAATFARKNPHFEARGPDGAQFAVRHFAGAVAYETRGFVAKNRDKLSTTLKTLGATGNRLVASFFADDARTKTLGSAFRKQLAGLTRVLEKTQPHFIRCIKSNALKQPDAFDAPLCLEQLRYSGLFEAIRIRRAGYAHRETHASFAKRYAVLVGNAIGSPQETCERVLAAPAVKGLFDGPFDVCVGRTKVFIKDGRARGALERLRAQRLGRFAKLIQAAWRAFRARFGAARRRRRSRPGTSEAGPGRAVRRLDFESLGARRRVSPRAPGAARAYLGTQRGLRSRRRSTGRRGGASGFGNGPAAVAPAPAGAARYKGPRGDGRRAVRRAAPERRRPRSGRSGARSEGRKGAAGEAQGSAGLGPREPPPDTRRRGRPRPCSPGGAARAGPGRLRRRPAPGRRGRPRFAGRGGGRGAGWRAGGPRRVCEGRERAPGAAAAASGLRGG